MKTLNMLNAVDDDDTFVPREKGNCHMSDTTRLKKDKLLKDIKLINYGIQNVIYQFLEGANAYMYIRKERKRIIKLIPMSSKFNIITCHI
jgi:hypothetical protein